MSNALEKHVLTPSQVHARPGLEDWRVLRTSLHTAFRTGSMTRGLELVERVVAAAEALDHHPDIDLRYYRVHLVLTTHVTRSLTEADVALAAQISVLASEMGLRAEPEATQHVEIAIDALDIPAVMPFWKAALGYRAHLPPGEEDESDADLVDRSARGPSLWFQQMDASRPQRNRIHLDINVPHDEARGRIAAALAAGGRLVSDEAAPAFWVLADAEGNEACICTWQGREASGSDSA